MHALTILYFIVQDYYTKYKVNVTYSLPTSYTSDPLISKCCSMLKIYDVTRELERFKMTEYRLVSGRAGADTTCVQ